MGGVFNGCCGTTEVTEASNETNNTSHEESKSNCRNKKNNNKSRKQNQFNDISTIQQEPGSETPSMDPKINLMEPKTLKLLSDLGEIKNYKQTLDHTQMEKNLKQHADILAQLENPTAFH